MVFVRRAAEGEGDDALAMSQRQHLRNCVEPPFFPEHRHKHKLEEKREIYLERSRNIFTIPFPQLLWISLFIRSTYHPNTAHFSISKRSMPKK